MTSEALVLAGTLNLVGPVFIDALTSRGGHLVVVGRTWEAAMYLREASRIALDWDDARRATSALITLSDLLNKSDPGAGADAARRAVDLAVRSGEAFSLAVVLYNLAFAQLATGEWDDCAATLAHPDTVLLIADESLPVVRGLLAALRGDGDDAVKILDGLDDLFTSEDPQDQEIVMCVQAFIAAADGRPADALRVGQELLDGDRPAPFSGDPSRWAWPLAARSAHDIGDLAAEAQLLAVFDRLSPGRSPRSNTPRHCSSEHASPPSTTPPPPAPGTPPPSTALRTSGTPYHLAHGLLDHAEYLADLGLGLDLDHQHQAAAAIAEATAIADRLGCTSLRDRAEATATRHGGGRPMTAVVRGRACRYVGGQTATISVLSGRWVCQRPWGSRPQV